ncbi:MAG: hypothetical protein ACTS8U_01750 [Arsenophonus sp. ET-DL9-MAG3]
MLLAYNFTHAKLEQQLGIDWLSYPRALLFISSYTIVNQRKIMILMNKNDIILADKFSHTFLLKTAMLSPTILKHFTHNQLDTL